MGGHREKAAGREKGIDNWSPVWYFVLIKAYIVSLPPLLLRCVAGGLEGTRWESGAYPVAVFAAARLCAERRPLWAGAHEKAGSRAGRFWQVLCRARLHEPEDLVMRGRLRTQIGSRKERPCWNYFIPARLFCLPARQYKPRRTGATCFTVG